MYLAGFLYLLTLIGVLFVIVVAAVSRQTRPRLMVWALALTLLMYAALIVAPFFAYGLHLEDRQAVAGGGFDPKGYPLFDGSIADGWLHFLALVFIPLAPFALIGLGVRLLVALWRGRQAWRQTAQIAAGALLAASVGALVFMASPLGRVIAVWHFD